MNKVILLITLWLSLDRNVTIDAFTPPNTSHLRSTKYVTALEAKKQSPIVVTLTREDGKNEKLKNKITGDNRLENQVDLLELPCIEHSNGPDFDRLPSTLLSEQWDYVAITSPEAAKILLSAWDVVQANPPLVVAVGKATEKKLKDSGIPVAFVPSKATAATLAKELELPSDNQTTSVLYPASAKAKKTLENDLMSRGFAVTRINTYDTVTAKWKDYQKKFSDTVQVACFGSPSAVAGWLQNTDQNTNVFAACIGSTSALACKELGWNEDHIFYPKAPGLDGWVDAIQEATEAVKEASLAKK
eukprot:CAMPEP_0197175740 /NCGR_PEP_ID=MMETSP1423-20130617/1882_1 /TAXON_ID=476441 /ORGANISM="Pseudo-nitzschia heimii, Strain UNC1101" /LENGTH=301 /DNA_ID=CAMNT_0042624971 /DNA_START=60 /DNA_END=965 /DNA_ORIENTATION=-